MFSNFKGWRTVAIAFVIGGLGAVQQFDWATVVPAEWTGVVLSVIGALMLILRSMTTTSIGKSE